MTAETYGAAWIETRKLIAEGGDVKWDDATRIAWIIDIGKCALKKDGSLIKALASQHRTDREIDRNNARLDHLAAMRGSARVNTTERMDELVLKGKVLEDRRDGRALKIVLRIGQTLGGGTLNPVRQKGLDGIFVTEPHVFGMWIGFGKRGAPEIKPLPQHGGPGYDRSYYEENTNTISIEKNALPGTIWHELGHWLTSETRGGKDAAHAFLNERSKGTKLKSLSTLDPEKPGYDKSEMARTTDLEDAYAGKLYKDGVTETVSMGFQFMREDPAGLWYRDREWFYFIVGMAVAARQGGMPWTFQ